jgi:hypothetical protein
LEHIRTQLVRCWRREELQTGSAGMGNSAGAHLRGARSYGLLRKPFCVAELDPRSFGIAIDLHARKGGDRVNRDYNDHDHSDFGSPVWGLLR